MSCQTSRTLLTLFLLAAAHIGAVSQRPRPPSPAIVRWKALVPEISDTLAHNGITCPGNRGNIQIVDASDPGAGGLSYALVDFCPGGAYTDWIVAMHIEAGKPVLSRFRNADGAMLDVGFASGASVMHTVDAKLVPEKKAIYDMFADDDGNGRLARCGVRAYVWNLRLKAFQSNAQLSHEATQSYCRTERETLQNQH